MTYDHILIRYGELSLKGKNRQKFIDRLKRNIKQNLKGIPNVEVFKTRDRMYIKLHGTPHEEVVKRLTPIFGIQSYSPALKVDGDLDTIKEASLHMVKEIFQPGMTFKITAKRADKNFPYRTNELNYELGAHILKNTEELTVDVHNPDINVRVEVRKDATYIMCHDYPGAGGLPAGSSGKAMLMISGGIDSPVAAYLAMKRGLELEAVHFYSPPFTSERAKQKVVDLVQRLTKFGGPIKLHIVPFTEIQQTIQQQIPSGYTMTSTRRMMLRITEQLRQQQEGLAILTGENLGQVASQTLESMYAINAVSSTPILRPLLTMDKNEIIALSKTIDTYEISIRPYEDCCTIFTPASPKTKPNLEKVEKYEEYTDFEGLIQEAVTKTESFYIETVKRATDEPSVDELF